MLAEIGTVRYGFVSHLLPGRVETPSLSHGRRWQPSIFTSSDFQVGFEDALASVVGAPRNHGV
jgi:hypothetical protein